jgi:uncharacterized membrane protein
MEFEEIRKDFVEKQQNYLKRDPRELAPCLYMLHAEKGFSSRTSIIFGIFFLLLAARLFAFPFLCNFEGGSGMAWLIGLGPLILAVGYFLSAGRRMRQKGEGQQHD